MQLSGVLRRIDFQGLRDGTESPAVRSTLYRVDDEMSLVPRTDQIPVEVAAIK